MARSKKIDNNEEVEFTVSCYFEELDDSYYKEGIEAIEYRWEKGIEVKET